MTNINFLDIINAITFGGVIINKTEREKYFLEQEDKLLKGGAAYSEWCTLITKSVYDSFVNGADLATIITSMVCIETYFKTESPHDKNKKLAQLIDEEVFLTEEEKRQLHKLRKYRNSWVHADRLNDTDLLKNEEKYQNELEEMSFLSVKMLLTVLFSKPFI